MIGKPFNTDKIKNAKTQEEKVGFENEKQTAYLLDFEYKNFKRLAVLHDIKLDYNGRTAQIDHLIITPIGIYVIESKFSSGIIKINENNWIIEYNGKDKAFASPIAQNDRHIVVLKDLLTSEDIFPGKKIPPIKNVVAISSSTIIQGKRPPEVFIAENIAAYVDSERKSVLKNPLKIITTLYSAYECEVKEIVEKLLSFDVSEKLEEHIEQQTYPSYPTHLKSQRTKKEEPKNNQLRFDFDKQKNLLNELKLTRTRLAKEFNIQMTHQVFANKTLEEMAEKMPGTKEEMLQIYGVGEVKFEKYGVHFLEVINGFKLNI